MFIKKISILLSAIFIFSSAGCTIVKNNSSAPPVMAPTPISTPENKVSPDEERDNHRISDIMNLSAALEAYAKSNDGQYPKTDGAEKISDEASSVFQTLKAGGFLFQPIKDSVPDKYYYGYNSDGQAYELTAVLENQKGGRCTMAGNYCIYKFKKENIGATLAPEAGQ